LSIALGPSCPPLAACRAAVPAVPKLGTGAVLSFLLTLAHVRIALAASVAGAVGILAASFAQALAAVAAGALLNTGAVTIALPAVELAVTVAPVAPAGAVMAARPGARIG
jgi:hypothetical protein